MTGEERTARRVLAELTPGMRMRSLFDAARAAAAIAPGLPTRTVGGRR